MRERASSGSVTVINYGSGSGSDFLTSYSSGSGSTSQKVTVPTVPVPVPVPQHWYSRVHKTTYAPMIYTALCVRFLMCADRLHGEVGGLALEIESFVGPCEIARADRRVLFHSAINHRCINSYI